MTKEAPKKHAHLSIFTRHLLLTRGVGFLSAFSLISSGMVWAQNQPVDNSFSIPSTPTSSTPAPAPAPAPRKVAPAPRVSAPAPAPRRVAPAPAPAPAPRKVAPAPRVSAPAPAPRRVAPAPAPAPAPRKVAPAPRVITPAPAPRRVAPAPAPAPAPRKIAPAPRVITPAPAPATVAAPTAPTISAPETSIKKPAVSVRETPRQSVVSPPKVSVPNPRPANPPQVVIPAEIDSPPIVNSNPNPTAANSSGGGKNSYIDSQNYGGSPRNNNQTLPAVVLTERSTGCKTVARNGQLAQASCNINAQRPQTARRSVTPSTPRITRNTNRNRGVLSAQGVRPVNYRPVNYARKQGKAPGRLSNPNYKAFKLGSVGNVSPASTKTYAGYNNHYAKTGRPVYASNDNTGLLFPLSIPATITSAFGWRVHPISGNYRMHTGTDIAAPTGTPVLASFIGRVSHADYMGGYGLTVVIRHTEEGNQESRYAHLSQVFVQPGDVVQQGEIIGLVGSTGNSTGPHLHFEWRHLMPSGWVPVDAGLHLEYAMHDLVNSLQAAQLNPISQK